MLKTVDQRASALIDLHAGKAAASHPPAVAEPAHGCGPLVDVVLDCVDETKAEDTTVIDLHGKTSIADTMIITSGRSTVHVNAIADRICRALKQAAATPPRIEGLAHGDWVLIDAGDVIVHVFRPEVRQFYNLEKMWGADRPSAA